MTITDAYCNEKLVWSESRISERSQVPYPYHDCLTEFINNAAGILRDLIPPVSLMLCETNYCQFISKYSNEFGDVLLIECVNDKAEKQVC